MRSYVQGTVLNTSIRYSSCLQSRKGEKACLQITIIQDNYSFSMELTCCAVRKCIGVEKGFKMCMLPQLEYSENEIYKNIQAKRLYSPNYFNT